ncbi:hypothetical protein Tco_0499695 [Tanacetum coccineum]
MKRGFRGAPRPLLPSMLPVATNPNAGQAHDAVAPSQPSSSTPPVPSTSSPPAVTTPAPIPVTTSPTIHTSTPTPAPIPVTTSPTIHTSTPTPAPIPVTTSPTIHTSTPTPPPIPTPTPPPIPTPTPPPIPSPTQIPDTEPTPFEHTYEESSPVHHHFSPPQEQAPSQMPMDDVLHEVPKLISRIDSLEMDLKQTKLTMGNAIVKLVKKVKKMEGFLKRRNLVLTDSEEEEPEAQGRKSQDDQLDSSVTRELVTPPTTKGTGDELLSTVDAKKSTSDQDKGQREGKAPMISEETPKKSKQRTSVTREASLLKLLGWIISKRLRLGLTKAKLEVDAELTKSMLGKVNSRRDFAKKMVDLSIKEDKIYFAEEM